MLLLVIFCGIIILTTATYLGWSFGGVVAFEAARQLMRVGFKIAGVVLIDSPTPINHVPLSEALLDSIVKLEGGSSSKDLAPHVTRQFTVNSRMLGHYNPSVTDGPFPPLTFLRSTEGLKLENVDVPSWLADRNDLDKLVEGWQTMVGAPVKAFDIPGNHFQPFKSENVSKYLLMCEEVIRALSNSFGFLQIEALSQKLREACDYLNSL